MIVAELPDSTKPDTVDFLRNSLIQKGILHSYGKRRKFKIKDKVAFMKLFKAFFVVWAHNNFQFEGKSSFCFVRLDKKNTLLLLPPKNIVTGYLNENNKSFYKDSVFEGIEKPPTVNPGNCAVYNFLNFNLVQFRKNTIELLHSKKGCGVCFKKYTKIIGEQIKDDPELGYSLGGYPLLIESIPSDLIRDLLKVYLAEARSRTEINSPLTSLLLAFICIYVGDLKKLGGGRTTCRIHLDTVEKINHLDQSQSKLKIHSNEIDAIIYSQQKKVLIVVEITTLFDNAFRQSWADRQEKQFPEHFKKTMNNFNTLFHYAVDRKIKFRSIYITLAEFSDEMKKLPEYFIFNKNKAFYHLNLNKPFSELKGLAETDSLVSSKIDNAFNDFISRIERATRF